MPTIRPFDGYLVNPARASAVVAPAYDAVSPEQRRRFAEANPDNFLNTMRLQEDFADRQRPGIEQLLQGNKDNLQRLLGDASFDAIDAPAFFIYQLIEGDLVQTGVVCEIGISEYEQGRVRKHENTRRDKEDLLTQYQQVVGVASSPICLAYKEHADINAWLQQAVRAPSDLDFVTDDGLRQRVWRLRDKSQHDELITMFATVDITYLTDGHHRAASGHRYAEAMRPAHGDKDDAPHNQLLVALFSDHELHILPYHRCVKDLGGLSEEQLLARLRENFQVRECAAAYQPEQHGCFGMLVNNKWHQLTPNEDLIHRSNPVASLDVSILQTHILHPILGIADMREDARLDYVSGDHGLAGLQQKHAEGWQVCFACCATSIDQLMLVADAGELMPPKSTYFHPKVRAGIFVRPK